MSEQYHRRDTWSQRLLRHAGSGALAFSMIVTAGCAGIEHAEDMTEEELFTALGSKMNSCSTVQPISYPSSKNNLTFKNRKEKCLEFRKSPTVALVYSDDADIDVEAFSVAITRGYDAMTGGRGDLSVTPYVVSEELGRRMMRHLCQSIDVTASPSGIAAAENPEVNANDLVIALNTRDSCPDEQYKRGEVGGVTYRVVGERLIDVFSVPSIGEMNGLEKSQQALKVINHELAHAALGSAHAMGTSPDTDLSVYDEDRSSDIGIDMSKIISVLSIHDYGNTKSIMGSGVYQGDYNDVREQDLLTPIDISEIARKLGGKGNKKSEVEPGRDARLKLNSKQFVTDRDPSFYDIDPSLIGGEMSGLMIVSSIDSNGQNGVDVYTKLVRAKGHLGGEHVRLGFLPIKEDQEVTLLYDDVYGISHELSVHKEDSEYVIKERETAR